MHRRIHTAVVATASDSVRRDAVLALSRAEIDILGIARNGIEALALTRSLRPDMLAIDADLPATDGYTLARRILDSFCMPVRPALALMRFCEFSFMDLPAGAVAVEKPVCPNAFIHAAEALMDARTVFSPGQMQRADDLLDALGFPGHIGRECLKQAILLCATDERYMHNLGALVYPHLGEKHGITARQAERAVRHAIERAWQSNQFENQYRIFADTVDAKRGQPTSSEMISRLADILRLEG